MNDSLSPTNRPSGMFGFTIVWAGQLISVLASTMTQFALTIWAYEKTGSATALGVINTAFIIPFLLLSPMAGVPGEGRALWRDPIARWTRVNGSQSYSAKIGLNL